jgi:tetratricopeptide (TPR) repeat protein
MKHARAMAVLLILMSGAVATSQARPDQFEDARRLTWDSSTRQQGIAALRSLVADHPGRLDMREALAEVLTWREKTRPEGIQLLESVLAEDPGRQSTRLILAEVLSWDRTRRDEAVELYQEALEIDPDSTPARVGLARVTSWQGDLAASHELYVDALRRDPADPKARMGLAEVQRWSGRSRDSLNTLSELDEKSINQPEARHRRAEAWLDLDRPARALDEYEAILATRPDDEKARRAVVSLRRDLAPSLEFGVEGNTESGDPLTSKLRSVNAPLVFNWGSRDWRYHAGAGLAFFANEPGSTRRTSVGGGANGPLGMRVRLAADAALRDFQGGDTEITGRLDVRIEATPRLEVVTGVRRKLLDDSRMAAAGETVGGVRYGPVLENAFFAGLSARPGRRWDLSAQGTLGSLGGEQVQDNNRQAFFAGFGRTFQPGRFHLRPGYTYMWMSYDLDLSGFPPQDLGGDGINTPGVGGYFSPRKFSNHMARLDASWDQGQRASYAIGGGLGLQRVEDTFTVGFGDPTLSSDVYARARWVLTTNWDLRGRASYQNVAAAFNRTRLSLFAVRRF